MVTSIVKGIWTTLKHPKLVLLLWVWHLLLALAAAWPARAWFGSALDTRPEAASLLARFNFGTFVDLSKYYEVSPMAFLMASMTGLALVAIVGSAFMMGGMLEVMGSEGDGRTFMHRFYRGGGHFFWRFTRLGICGGVAAAIVGGIVAAAVGAATNPLTKSEWEPAGMVWGAVTVVVAVLAASWFVLALDYARIRVARDGGRGMARAYAGGVVFVARHVLASYTIAILACVVVAVLFVAYIAHETVWTTGTWATIGILIATQQAIAFARTGVRVAQVAAEREYFLRASPAQPAEPAATPVPVVPAPTVPVETPPPAPTTEVTTEVSDAAPTRLTRP